MKDLSYDRKLTYGFYILIFFTAIYDIACRDGVKIPRIILLTTVILGMDILSRKTFLKKAKMIYVMLLIFLFASIYLANIFNFYAIAYYDKYLHFASGILVGIIGLWVYFYMFGIEKDKKSKINAMIFVMMFSIAVAGLWEIWEFSTDQIFGLTAQRDLIDTMLDMILASLATIAVLPFINMYFNGKNIKIIDSIVKEVREK